MKIASLHAAMVWEEKGGYLGPGHLKHGWIRKLWEAAQYTDEVYRINITILGHIIFEKSCPFSLTGFTIRKSVVVIHVRGRESPRIEDKWARIAEERFNVPVKLAWVKNHVV